jgi:cytochrome c556
MTKKLVAAGVALALGAGYALTAFSQGKPETLIKQRQAVMTLHWKYFGPLLAMARGRAAYDANVVARNAGYLETLSKMPWSDFDPSTKNVKSPALPAIFTEPAKFKQAQDQYQAEIAKLVTVSKTGDEASVKAQIGAVDKACGNCHDNFREPF